MEGLSATPVGPEAAPTAVVPIRVSAPLVKSRLNSLSVPSPLLVANTSPAVGVAVGPALPVDVDVGPAVGVTSGTVQEVLMTARRAQDHEQQHAEPSGDQGRPERSSQPACPAFALDAPHAGEYDIRRFAIQKIGA